MENSHLLVAGSVYLLGLVCFFGYILQEIGWLRSKGLRKFKQRIFYMVWAWSVLWSAVVNWTEGLPLGMMLFWGLAFFFAAWFIKEGLFRIACAVRRRKKRRCRRR